MHCQAQILGATGNRTGLSDNGFLPSNLGIMSGIEIGQPSGRGKQAIQATEMRGYTNTATSISSQPKRRAARGNNGGLTSTASARRTCQIPGIIRTTIDRILTCSGQ